MSEKKNNSDKSSKSSKLKTLLISLVILFVAAVVTVIIFMTEPKAKRQGATKKTAMLVDVVEAERGNFAPMISVTGTVIPSQDIILSPRVSGEIVSRSDAFTPGSYVKKGDLLLRIDPSDYRNALQLRKSELHQAEADLEIEMGRQDVARQDYSLIDENLSEENESLVLRKPQLNAVKARIEAARASVQQAELDLQRTNIRAPFDALIINRNANVGSQVAVGENLGRLVGIEEYWVETTVPLSQLRWLNFPDNPGETGSAVKIRNRTTWGKGKFRRGYLYRLIGSLEDETRLARVLVTVKDPLALQKDSDTLPQLMIGAFVEANIIADTISKVFRISRDYIRKDETVWLMQEDTLNIKTVEIIFRDAKYAYVINGLNEDDKIVTTNLSTVVQGAALRTEENDSIESSAPANEGGGR